MNFFKYFIRVICFVVIMSCSMVMAADKVTFSGGKIIFPDVDSIPDANIADLTFNLDKVPAELKFMVGKIYRGQGKNPRLRVPGTKQYIFLYGWTEEKMTFLAARSSHSKVPAKVYTLTCPSKLSQEFNCIDDEGQSVYRFSVQEGKPVLDATNGGMVIFEEVALIPSEILKQTGK
jgi:hypothetical protein